MIEMRKILCPTDFSEHSRHALDHALAIARWYEATVTVLHVFNPVPVGALAGGPMAFEPIIVAPIDRDQLVAETKAFAEASGTAGVEVDAVLCEGPAASTIVAEAAARNADLIVIGTHGRSGFERLVLGSVTERVLRKAGCPVMTVPRRQPQGPAAGPVLFKRILCPVDFSDSSMRALTYATSLAQEADGALTVLHVMARDFEDPGDMLNVGYDAGMTLRQFLEARELGIQQRLQDIVAMAPEFCRAESQLTHGRAWREILRVAGERASDLIVMGVQGRGAVDLMFFGSTAQHVVREATCPVLTLRA